MGAPISYWKTVAILQSFVRILALLFPPSTGLILIEIQLCHALRPMFQIERIEGRTGATHSWIMDFPSL